MGVLAVSIQYRLAKLGIFKSKIFRRDAKKLDFDSAMEYFYKQ